MIAGILPSSVAAVEAYGDDPSATLFPQEAATVARALPRRRSEHATVRQCARRALAELGVAPMAITTGARGAPRWPAGVVGSMTHCAGYRAAAVARASLVATVGIDAEPHEPLPAGVLEVVALPAERTALQELAAATPDVCWDRLLFCIKEAAYKAWFPLTQRWLDFDDVTTAIDRHRRTFLARTPRATTADGRPLGSFAGRWAATGGLLAAAVALPASQPVPGRREEAAAGPGLDRLAPW